MVKQKKLIDILSTKYVYKSTPPGNDLCISTPYEAARIALYTNLSEIEKNAQPGLITHIERFLKNDTAYKKLRGLMPPKTPKELQKYRTNFSQGARTSANLNNEILREGAFLKKGQILFHGGIMEQNIKKAGNRITLSDPLSTSLSPVTAYNEALYRGKAYDENSLTLFMLNVKTQNIKAYIYNLRGTMQHEFEIILQSNINIDIKNTECLGEEKVCGSKSNDLEKKVSVVLIMADII